MSTKLNSIISDGTLNIDTDMDISYQTTFSFAAPHCVADPVTADDLTNKAYVDSRLVNSGSGTNLYFNYSVSDAISPYRQLGTSIVITTQTTLNTPQAGTQTIASFITDSGYPGTVTIPSGIWELNQFGKQVGGSAGVLRYFFTLYKRDLAGNEILLGTSGYSADINTSVTDVFFAQLTLGILTLLSTDRLIVNIFSLGTGTDVGHTLDSQFQNTTYSYITTPLVSGSNFLSLNNTFTGSNSFTNATTNIGSMVVSANALNSNNINTEVLIGNNLIGTSSIAPGAALKVGYNLNYGSLQLATRAGRSGDTRIHDGAFSGGNVYIGSGATNMYISAGTGSTATGSINIGFGFASLGDFNLGSATRKMSILGTSLSTISTGIITLQQTPTAYPTVGSTVPTTTWVSDALTYLKANINTWDLAQTFTTVPVNNGTVGSGSANNTNVPTTAWVQTALTYFKTQSQTWDLAQTFTTVPINNGTVGSGSANNTNVPTTAWVQTALTYFKTQSQTWDLAQTFTTVPINNGTIGSGSANNTNVPTTAWVQTALTYFKTQSQTWDLTQTFTSQPVTNASIPAYPLFDTGLVTSTWVKNAIAYAEKGKITSASTPVLAITGTLTFAKTYTVIPLVLLTVDMGSGTVIVSAALAGTTLTTFSYILSSLAGVSSLNYYVVVI